MPTLQIEDQKGHLQFHIANAISPLIKRKVLGEYFVQTVIEHSRGESSKHQTDKAKVQQSGSRQVVWDENSPPSAVLSFSVVNISLMILNRLLLLPDDQITFHLWSTHNPLSSGIIASTESRNLHSLTALQGTLDDREKYISLPLHAELKPPSSPRRSASPRSPRHSTESGTSASNSTTESHSSSPSSSDSKLVINIRAIIRDSPKSAQEWNEARQRLKEEQERAVVLKQEQQSDTPIAGSSAGPGPSNTQDISHGLSLCTETHVVEIAA